MTCRGLILGLFRVCVFDQSITIENQNLYIYTTMGNYCYLLNLMCNKIKSSIKIKYECS